jgi:hypothetical protein
MPGGPQLRPKVEMQTVAVTNGAETEVTFVMEKDK